MGPYQGLNKPFVIKGFAPSDIWLESLKRNFILLCNVVQFNSQVKLVYINSLHFPLICLSKYGEINDNQNIPYVSKHFGKPKRKTIKDGVAPPYKLLTPALTA